MYRHVVYLLSLLYSRIMNAYSSMRALRLVFMNDYTHTKSLKNESQNRFKNEALCRGVEPRFRA